MTTYGFEAQLQIYSRMLTGQVYDVPLGWTEWQERAKAALMPGPWGYVEGGAGAEETMVDNRAAFTRWKLQSRMLRNVEDRDLGIDLLGHHLPVPFLLAPVGVQSIVHQDAERAPARAAAKHGIPFVLSTVSSVTIEEIASIMGDAPRWFQLYPGRDPDVVASFIKRAENAGYSALVVTVDTTMLGWREADLRNAYLPFLQGEGIVNFLSDPAFRARLTALPEADPQAAVQEFLNVYVNPAFTWDSLKEIRGQTKLPLLIKGITHPDDAALAFELGADGVIVSNHGGRQVDGGIAALDALVNVRAEVGSDRLVLMDSGVRTAADILKAKALGADAVLMGRPYIYALAAGGGAAIEQWLFHLMAELDLEMALAGYAHIGDIDASFVTRIG